MKRIYNPLAEMKKIGWKEGYEEGYKIGYEKGYEEGFKIGMMEIRKKEVCLILLKEGTYSEKKIASLLKIPQSKVKKLKKTIQAQKEMRSFS